MSENLLSKTLLESFIKKSYEKHLRQATTGLIIYACGDENKPEMAWGRASDNALGYGMKNYKDLKKVRDSGGDVSDIIARKEKYKNGYDDAHIDLIKEHKGEIWVYAFIPTLSKQKAIALKEFMYETKVFKSKVMRYEDRSRPEVSLLAVS